jgi:hypothetical protein
MLVLVPLNEWLQSQDATLTWRHYHCQSHERAHRGWCMEVTLISVALTTPVRAPSLFTTGIADNCY